VFEFFGVLLTGFTTMDLSTFCLLADGNKLKGFAPGC